MTFQVSTRASTPRQEGVVVLTPPKGSAVALSAVEARALQSQILMAVIGLERGDRATRARAKTAEQRKLRRAATVDEQLREREG